MPEKESSLREKNKEELVGSNVGGEATYRVKKIRHPNGEFQYKWDWINALRGYAIFAALTVSLAIFVDHYIVAMALLLMMSAWVIVGTFSISESMRQDISDEERRLANIRNTALFSTGTFLPIVAIFSGTGKIFTISLLGFVAISFTPTFIKMSYDKIRYVVEFMSKKIRAFDDVYAYHQNDPSTTDAAWHSDAAVSQIVEDGNEHV